MLKGLFKDSHPIVQLIILGAAVLIGVTIGGFVWGFVFAIKEGFSPDVINSFLSNVHEDAASLREMQFFSALGGFIFPAILSAYLFSDNYKQYLKVDTPWNFSLALWTILSMIVAIPLLNFLAYYNQQLTFPEAFKPIEELLRSQEAQNAKLTETMLYAENTRAFIFNIVIIAIFAAVGEELIFRGVLQNICEKIKMNYHLIIWIVAIIFSAIHFQFFGFVPRLLMGAYFGYLIYYTKNMWMPVLAHFTNNFVIVVLYRIYQDQPEKIEAFNQIGIGEFWMFAVVSLVLFAFIFYQIRRSATIY